ncbi:MAG TPA: hypothetical protein VFE33_30160 [Thermoanaerobaculia bacterium]|nr:hypothetical protein [Thermoanaerobaculia bacterium]
MIAVAGNPATVSVPVAVTYDYQSGGVQIAPPGLTVDAATVISLTITTVNQGSGEPASFYGFNTSPNWPASLSIVLSSVEIQITDPGMPAGDFTFNPLLRATGAPITTPVVLNLTNV